MMKSRHLWGILLGITLLCAALSGCGGPSAEQPTLEQPTREQPDVEWPDMISVYGVCYQRGPALDSEPRPEDVDILGYLNYTGREKAFHHAQANFPAAQGAPVARSPLVDYSEGMIARLPDGWALFLPMEPEPTEPGEQGDGETWTHIRVDGITYVPDTPRFGRGLSLQIEDSQILGYLTYTGDRKTMPTRHGETNLEEAQGAPWARSPLAEHPEGIVVWIYDLWRLFLPEEKGPILLDWPASEPPLLIQAGGVRYRGNSEYPSGWPQVTEDQILGYLTYTGNRDTPPSRDGETNFTGAEGAPYARCPQEEYSEGLIVLCGGCWWLFLSEAQ